MKPLLSIVFPTRNRSQYLIDSVRLTLREIADCEVIIADNSDDDALGRELKNNFNDLVCTSNHKWRILVEDGYIWKKTKDIQKGDLLVGCDNFNGFLNKPCDINWSKKEIYEKLKKDIKINKLYK